MSADPNSSARIFLSYRRDDVPDAVDRIADRLRERFGTPAVFVDIVSIAAGELWREVLTRALHACEAILIVIGPHWLRKATDGESLALDDPDDLVRNEIATALGRDISVIPILWGDARFPPADALPPEIREMTEYQAFSIRREHFESDVRLLLERVEAQVRLFASSGRRLAAFIIDLFPALAISAAIGVSFWVLLVAYHWLLVGATGRTLGKLLMGTRVESSEPTITRWIFALARPLLGYPILLLSGFGAVQLVLHPQHLAIHDRLFRAQVVQVRRRPLAAGLRRIDGVSYFFDEWLFKLLAGAGLGFSILWAKSFFGLDRPVQWVRDALDRLRRPASGESGAHPVEGAKPFTAAAPPTAATPPVAASLAPSGAASVLAGGAHAVGAGAFLVAAPPLIVGLVLAAVSIAIYEGVAPTSLSVSRAFGSREAALAVPEPGQKLPIDARVPIKGCRAFFSGLLVSDVFEDYWTSEAFVVDRYSEYVGSGNYHDNTEAFPKSIASTFDGIAIDVGTHVEIFSEKNFGGEKLLDITGPAIINNSLHAAEKPKLATKEFKVELQSLFPQAVRHWSMTDMNTWGGGSLRITCAK